jgi:hypothetical protein
MAEIIKTPIEEILSYCSITFIESNNSSNTDNNSNTNNLDMFVSCQDETWLLLAEYYTEFISFLRSKKMDTPTFKSERIKTVILVSSETPSRIVMFQIKKIKVNIKETFVRINALMLFFFRNKIQLIFDWFKSFFVYNIID